MPAIDTNKKPVNSSNKPASSISTKPVSNNPTPVNPVQAALVDLAAKGATITDPVNGNIIPVQHLPEAGPTATRRGPAPKSKEELEKARQERKELQLKRDRILKEAQEAVAAGDAVKGAEMLKQLTDLMPKPTKTDHKTPGEKLLTKLKGNEQIRSRYESLGGDKWLMNLLTETTKDSGVT